MRSYWGSEQYERVCCRLVRHGVVVGYERVGCRSLYYSGMWSGAGRFSLCFWLLRSQASLYLRVFKNSSSLLGVPLFEPINYKTSLLLCSKRVCQIDGSAVTA